jgi:hypothetical protein
LPARAWCPCGRARRSAGRWRKVWV